MKYVINAADAKIEQYASKIIANAKIGLFAVINELLLDIVNS